MIIEDLNSDDCCQFEFVLSGCLRSDTSKLNLLCQLILDIFSGNIRSATCPIDFLTTPVARKQSLGILICPICLRMLACSGHKLLVSRSNLAIVQQKHKNRERGQMDMMSDI